MNGRATQPCKSLQGYIFHIYNISQLQLRNYTNFGIFFLAVVFSTPYTRCLDQNFVYNMGMMN